AALPTRPCRINRRHAPGHRRAVSWLRRAAAAAGLAAQHRPAMAQPSAAGQASADPPGLAVLNSHRGPASVGAPPSTVLLTTMTTFRLLTRSLAYLTLGLSLLTASAMAQSSGADASAQVQQRFSSQFPNIRVDGVSATPYGGLYEIRVGNTLLYADEAVSYVLEGNLIDGATR